jgi:hypothetical protein
VAKGKKKNERDFTPEPVKHIPKNEHPHLAREYAETRSAEDVDSLTRRLMPHMRDRALGKKPGTTTHKGWFPSTRTARF